MASSMKKTNRDENSVESKQLLYSDVFGQSYQEDRLRIVGKSKTQERLQTFSVPHSSVLSQIKSFLPQLSDANLKLAKDIETNPQRADEVNIEHVDEDSEGKHIEMNLSMMPTNGQDTLHESDSESDESSEDEDGIGDTDEMGENISDNKDNAHGLQTTESQLRGSGADRNEQTDLIKLKLPLANKSRNKHKASIQEIECNSDSFQAESANG